MTPIGYLAFFLAIPVALVAFGLVIWAMVKLGAGIFNAIGLVVGRIFEFIGGVFGDAARIIGALIAGILMIPLALLNVMIGRWSAANHYAEVARREAVILGGHTWSLLVRRPLRLLFLESMLKEVEGRAVDAVREAPGADRPRGEVNFPGFEVVGSLPSGGSGAKLYIARPDAQTRLRLEGTPQEVVIKSFAMSDGSSLPQIVRESRSLESARRLGLVLAHQLDDTTFWYAMPYHPGDHLGITVREAHAADFEDGLRGERLDEMLGYAIDLVRTLDRYHREGLWHKDVKPDNIIIHDGSAHLVDFGLVTSLRSAMTLTTHGTEYFRDPEMVRMAMRGVKVHEVDGGKFDVYGAGAVLYFMLENTFPGHGGLSRFERPAPEALRWVVRRAMADYTQRYESTAVMLADLQAVSQASDPWSVTPAMLPSMREETTAVEPGPDERETVVDVVRSVQPSATPSPPPPPPPPPPPVARVQRRGLPWFRRADNPALSPVSPGDLRSVQQVGSARRRAEQYQRSVRKKRSQTGVSKTLALGITAAIIAVVISIASIAIMDSAIGTYRATQVDYRGPLGFPHGWEENLAEGEIPRPVDSPRLVMLENHRELRGTHADLAISALRSSLEDRGWEIVDDPEILAESIIDMPREGIANLDAAQIAIALESLDELSEKHRVETVLFVRTEGDDHGGMMDIEFWTDGQGSIMNLPLFPDSSLPLFPDSSRNTTMEGRTRNAHVRRIDSAHQGSRHPWILQGEVRREIVQEPGSSRKKDFVKYHADRKLPLDLGQGRIDPVLFTARWGEDAGWPTSVRISNN